jgi:transcriptional regulator GlxA family with amidase domain
VRLGDLAAAAALSQAHLARSFRNATGIALHRYVLHRRLERARSLLSQAGARAQTVAVQCGFADASHPTKAYRIEKRTASRPHPRPTKQAATKQSGSPIRSRGCPKFEGSIATGAIR